MRKLTKRVPVSSATAFRFRPISPARWPEAVPGHVRPSEFWLSSAFMAQVFELEGGAVRVSINRTSRSGGDWEARITWDELQAVKEAIGFGGFWAVEIYPPADSVVNVANIRHLFILSEAPAFAWTRPGEADRRPTRQKPVFHASA